MLRFFRQIRQQLLNQSKFSKYLMYAVGEILLVVIGILIALQINNWNAHNLDRISEADYLKRLSNDLIRDTLNYSWTSRDALYKQEALGNLLSQLQTDQYKTLDSIQILKNIFLGRLLSFAQPNIITGTFEELKNTGNFKQLESTSLRTDLTDYYSSREHQYFRIEKKRIESSYGDEVDKIIPGIKRNEGDINYRTDLVSFKEIMDNIGTPTFRKIIISEYNFAVFMGRIQEEGLEESKDLLNKLKAELAY